jgi:hypothetical protein
LLDRISSHNVSVLLHPPLHCWPGTAAAFINAFKSRTKPARSIELGPGDTVVDVEVFVQLPASLSLCAGFRVLDLSSDTLLLARDSSLPS